MANVGELVDGIASAALAGVEAQLRPDGAVMPPTMFILAEDLDQPLLCSLGCRPFYPGADAVAAITAMGIAPAVMAATRIVLTWEAQDLNAALAALVNPAGSALCVLDAQLAPCDVLRYHPLRMRPGPDSHRTGGVIPEWGTPDRIHNPSLPDPIERLLHRWRDGWEPASGEVVNDAVIELQTAGYSIRFMER